MFSTRCGKDVGSLLFCFRIIFQKTFPDQSSLKQTRQKHICSLASGARKTVQGQDALWHPQCSWHIKQ